MPSSFTHAHTWWVSFMCVRLPLKMHFDLTAFERNNMLSSPSNEEALFSCYVASTTTTRFNTQTFLSAVTI